MMNVSDAGVKALAEAGCGSGLRTLILGGFRCVPCVRIMGVGLRFGAVTCFWLVVLLLLFIFVAMPRDVLVSMNCGVR